MSVASNEMQFLDLTLATPEENLALDESLLQAVDGWAGASVPPDQPHSMSISLPATDEGRPLDCQVLRIWRATRPFIVLGRSSQAEVEVHLDRARQQGIPILRRFSGGASVVVAPGCLLYSLLIHLDSAPGLRLLDVAHRFVMERLLRAIQRLVPAASFEGTCDLALEGRKFSGNSLRVGRNWMLYHGTLLLDMQLSMVDELLRHPPREPAYRSGRTHASFLTNLEVDERALIREIREAWQTRKELTNAPLLYIPRLVSEKYSKDTWNLLR